MTDNEIVKALEYCTNCVCNNDKDECPLLKMSFCKNYLMKQSLDLINRQQADIEKNENIIRLADKTIETANAEIERLKTNLNIELENYATEYDNKIKSEAYREFAVRLLALIGSVELPNLELKQHINNLLNELVGDDE